MEGLINSFGMDPPTVTLCTTIPVPGSPGLIELHVVLEYGVRISTVGQNIIDNVKFRIKELTNLEPDQVSVIVEGIRIK